MTVEFSLDGRTVAVPAEGTLLEALRALGAHAVKDGCSPQGQCGCCTVRVDGKARVACVTPVRRVAGKEVITFDGLPADRREVWTDAMCATGGSQCGFCTPGIVVRLDGEGRGSNAVNRALAAHLCRCTGWQTIAEAAELVASGASIPSASDSGRDLDAASRRATIEGHALQRVAPSVAAGQGGFAADTAPADALVAVPDGDGGWVVADSLAEARAAAGKVQGRHSTVSSTPPLEVPAGDWALTLQTSWVEPAYLETDASWCVPGGEPASALANGGAFGAKTNAIVGEVARRLADEHDRAVLVVLSREDTVRLGPKRPPLAAGVALVDGEMVGELHVARSAGIADVIASVAPGVRVTEVDVPGPPTSMSLRGAGWVEAAVLSAALAGTTTVQSPDGAVATVEIAEDATVVRARVSCGDPLDAVTLRSYCIGAVHQALGWVTSESIAVDGDGTVCDLTVRSFGIVRPGDMVHVDVEVEPSDGEPVNGSDAVFAAMATAVWQRQGCPGLWPTGVGLQGSRP